MIYFIRCLTLLLEMRTYPWRTWIIFYAKSNTIYFIMPRCNIYNTLHLKLIPLIIWLFVCHANEVLAKQFAIKGIVVDEHNNAFSGAHIRLNGNDHYAISDSSGQFIISYLAPKKYDLTVTAVGYRKINMLVNPSVYTNPLRLKLVSFRQQLTEIEIKSNHNEQLKKTESLSIQLIEEEFLKEAQGGSLMQTLKRIPGVNSMDVGTGLSKPMIRGMSYYRVAVAQNGIKMEGQQWSNHHGVAVDQQAVNHVEIVKGPASLQYGSDAIGGVINLLPGHVPLKSGFTGDLALVGKTNTNWYGASTDLSYRTGDFYINSTLTHNNYGDFSIHATDSFLLITPASTAESGAEQASHKQPLGNRIDNTAGFNSALSTTLGLVKPWGNSYIDCSYFGSEIGFFDWQEEQKSGNRDIKFPKQQVDNYTINHFTNRYFEDDKLAIALGYQQNKSQEFDYLNDVNGSRNEDLTTYKNRGNLDLWLRLQTFTGNLFYTLNKIDKHTVKLGFNSQFQLHHTDGYNHILPEYNRLTTGAFITDKYQLSETWIINGGMRFDYHNLEIEASVNPDPQEVVQLLNTEINTHYIGTAFAFGGIFLPNNSTTFKANIGKSYRVPSVYELAAYGLHRHEGRFEKGDSENDPEIAWQLDLGYNMQVKKLTVSASPFINYFTNYLYLNPTPLLVKQGQVYQYQQSVALLTGGEISAVYQLYKSFDVRFGAEYVYGVNLDKKTALPATPPLNAQVEVSYHIENKKWYKNGKASLEMVSTASQNYTVTNELNTPGYTLFNALLSGDIWIGNLKLMCHIKANNLLNTNYFNHLSYYRRLRIPEPGRDLQLSINIPINN